MNDRDALEELLKLSNHYAMLLNQYDGGRRQGFKNAEHWIERLVYLESGDCADDKPACESCGKPATCWGAYEHQTAHYSCNECCGHGCEDGWCEPLEHDPDCKGCPDCEGAKGPAT